MFRLKLKRFRYRKIMKNIGVTSIRGISYSREKRGYYVRKNSKYIGFFFYLKDAKRALDEFLREIENTNTICQK